MDAPDETRSPRLWAAAAALCFAAAAAAVSASPRGGLPRFERPVLQEYAVTDMAAALLGTRRFGADLAFIQMLQYYGTEANRQPSAAPSAPSPEAPPAGHHGMSEDEVQADTDHSRELPFFPRLRDHILRAAALDPHFEYVNLFGAGALAFNLNRTAEALDVLRRGSEADPTFWRYRLYAGAIGFRKSAQTEKVIDFLEEAMRYPDCPSMLQNILANIHKKRGNLLRAAEIYLHMLSISRDQEYVSLARQKLDDLRRDHGIVVE